MKKILLILLFPFAAIAQQQTINASDNLNQGRVKMNSNFTELYTDKAPKASPVFTGNPTTPNKIMGDSSLSIANTAFIFRNALTRNSPNYNYTGNAKTFKIYPISENPTHGTKPIEFLNYGYTGAEPSSERHAVTGGFIKTNWSMSMVHNHRWDSVNNRATTYDTDFPTSAIEAGGEGASIHVAPQGSTWYTVPTMTFLVSGNGPRGILGYTSGYVNQFMGTMYAHYGTDSYQSGKLRSWNTSTATDPLLFLHAEETKGSDHELAKFEMNSSTTSPPAFYFLKSRGTYASKTAMASGDVVGRHGYKGYDGDEYHINAYMDVVGSGTVSNNTVPMDMRFFTSSTNQASGTEKFRITHDGAVRASGPLRTSLSTVSGIPSYTAATSLVPTPIATEFGNFSAVSTANGGLNVVGLTNNTAGGFPLILSGIHGSASPTSPAIRLAGRKTNGSTNFTDLAATEIVIQFANNGTVLTEVLGNGKTGFGNTTPHSRVHTTSLATAYVAKTALYTLTDADYTVEVTSGTHTQTLPTAVGITGRQYVITNSGSGTVTVGTTSSQTFVNVTATPTTLTLAQFETAIVQSNGANWLRLR